MDDLAAIRQGLLRLRSIIAAERFSRALYRHYLVLKAGYRPDQLRDELGRWADEGGGSRSRVRLAANERPPLGPRSLTKIAVELAQRAIDRYRTEEGLWDLFRRRVGTVTTTEIDGVRHYGSNSTAPSYSNADYREAEAMRDILVAKYPKVMNTTNPGGFPNNALFHAEANVLMRAAREGGGNLGGKSIEVFTDRPVCNHCQEVLPYLGLELGNPTVTFVGPHGATRTMRDGAWVQP